MWNTFRMKEIEDYVYLCNMQDVLAPMAADINFVILASFSWEYTLKITKTEFKQLTNVNTILDYENGIREGITKLLVMMVKQYNNYMHDYNYDNYNYDKTKESACIQYLDFNINT